MINIFCILELTNNSLPFKSTFDHPSSVCMTFNFCPSFTFSTTFDSVVGFSRTLSTSAVTIVSAIADVVKAPNPRTVAVAAPIIFS